MNPVSAFQSSVLRFSAAAVAILGGVAAGQALQPGFDQSTIGNVDGRTRAWGIGVADFNGDTIPDIVSGDTNGDVHLYLGSGDGTFSNAGIKINQLFNNAYGLAVGDFNGDTIPDIVLSLTTTAEEGQLHLYPGNGDGSFQIAATGALGEQLGVQIGVAGTDVISLAAGDVDADGDLDLVSGEIFTGTGDTADILLWRNQQAQGSPLSFVAETIVAANNVLDAENPPYYPPTANLHAYGLALGDVTGDDVPDLLIGDKAHYLYVYKNAGGGVFSPLRYDKIATRPFAFARLDPTAFNEGIPLALADCNDDGALDLLTGNAGTGEGSVSLWVNEGVDASGRPVFTGAGVIGSAGTDARGLATGQLNPSTDMVADAVFGNFEGNLQALLANIVDTDEDGLIDAVDNAPLQANAPRIDINTDGGLNYLDQLDNDGDGIGDPADDDDDNDGVPDLTDNAPFTANADQADSDGDGMGDASDPFNNEDGDGDGVADGPLDPMLFDKAQLAKGRWSRSDTHFIIRIDALARAFQNEFVQTFVDAAILTSSEWELKKFDNYNGIGDEPATPGYNVPADLPGGVDCPITVATIPRLIWNAFGDPDPINWINARIANPNLEISQHGTYHTNNTPFGDWADLSDRNFYSSEFAGLTLEENYQLLRVGHRTLLGDYTADPWILQSGIDPATAPKIDWSIAANPLISYAPPYNTGDTVSRDATARLGFVAFSASIAEESGSLAPFFSPEGSHHEAIDQFGMFHASADLEVDPEAPTGQTYLEFLQSITQIGGLNTWLIEEVSWSTRYCNTLDRLEPCPAAPEGVNRENNMVDPDRWANWLTLLSYAKGAGEVMTMGDYALAMQFDNAPTVANPDQADADHDGIGDVIDGATLTAGKILLEAPAANAEAVLTATVLNATGGGIAGQVVTFYINTDGDENEEAYTATTGTDGVATVSVFITGTNGDSFAYRAAWDGGLAQAEGAAIVQVGTPNALKVVGVDYTPGGAFSVTVEGLNLESTYRLARSVDLLSFSEKIVSGFIPTGTTDTLVDPAPAGPAFYRVEEE